jgi:hypothetical protein
MKSCSKTRCLCTSYHVQAVEQSFVFGGGGRGGEAFNVLGASVLADFGRSASIKQVQQINDF